MFPRYEEIIKYDAANDTYIHKTIMWYGKKGEHGEWVPSGKKELYQESRIPGFRKYYDGYVKSMKSKGLLKPYRIPTNVEDANSDHLYGAMFTAVMRFGKIWEQ